MKLTGNTILTTGGGSGIGRGLAEVFHHEGNKVIVAGRDQTKLDAVVAANPGMWSLAVDVTSPASIRALVARASADFPSLNIVIHNAGIMRTEDLLNQQEPWSVVDDIVATNLVGPIRLTAELLPTLRKQPQAVIIFVSSGLAFLPLAITPTYCATKAAIHSYVQSLRYQLHETSIEVIELIPPYVRTALMGDWSANDPSAMPLEEFIAELCKFCASRRRRRRST